MVSDYRVRDGGEQIAGGNEGDCGRKRSVKKKGCIGETVGSGMINGGRGGKRGGVEVQSTGGSIIEITENGRSGCQGKFQVVRRDDGESGGGRPESPTES